MYRTKCASLDSALLITKEIAISDNIHTLSEKSFFVLVEH